MAGPVAKSASVEFWNRVVLIDDDDAVGLDRAIFQLRGLVARNPSDMLARMGLGYGLLLRGNRSEAMSHVDGVLRDLGSAAQTEKMDLVTLLTECGRLEEARSVLDPVLKTGPVAGDITLLKIASQLALVSGDLTLIDQASACTGLRNDDEWEFRTFIGRVGLESLFQQHQKAGIAALGSHCCGINVSVVCDPEEGDLTLLVDVFTDLSADDQFRAYDWLDEAIPGECRPVEPYVAFGINGPRVRSVAGMVA